MVSIRDKTLLSEIMDPDFIFVQKAGTCFLYVYFQGTGFLGVSIFMGTVYSMHSTGVFQWSVYK